MGISAAHFHAFFREVRTHGKVWGIRDDDGFPAPLGSKGLRAMPFWSTESRVKRIIANAPAYALMQPVELTVDDFLQDWLPDLERELFLVGINWSGPTAKGYDAEPAEVIRYLTAG